MKRKTIDPWDCRKKQKKPTDTCKIKEVKGGVHGNVNPKERNRSQGKVALGAHCRERKRRSDSLQKKKRGRRRHGVWVRKGDAENHRPFLPLEGKNNNTGKGKDIFLTGHEKKKKETKSTVRDKKNGLGKKKFHENPQKQARTNLTTGKGTQTKKKGLGAKKKGRCTPWGALTIFT